jgi:outer membrane immunogenic protein
MTSTTATPGDPNGQRPIFGIVNVATASSTFDRSGWLGGVQAGYNWQFSPRWVAGIEADFDWADLAGDGASATTLFGGSNPATFSASQKIEWLGTLRARLGYLSTENLLLFATGGLAYGKVNETTSTALPAGATNSIGNFNYGYGCGGIYGGPDCFAGAQSRTSVGWSAGAGAEFAISRGVIVKLEYLHVDLGSRSFSSGAQHYSTQYGSLLNVASGAAFDLVRAGVNFRF